MEFLFAGDNQAPENQDPFEALSELCTFLAIADDGVAPLEPIGQRILEALQKSKMDGDVQVMASRALALLLDKFASSFLLFATKGKSSIADCLRHVFSQVTSHRSTLKFAKTTPSELTEELLRCLTLGTSSSAEVQAAMPSAELQLVFCEGSLDGAKWTSCKILRHCALLTRSGSVKQPSDRSRVHAMLHQHLTSLCVLDIDFEWDELLRAVTEGYLTLRAWSPGSDDITEGAAPAQAQANSTDSKKRHVGAKRAKGADSKESCHTTTAPSTSSVDQLYIDLAVRVCSSGMADSRKELVLACVNSVLLATSSIASDERRRALDHLVALLKETSEVTATITDPFVPKKSVTSDKDDGDSFKSLANLQWEVPALQWSALMIVAKLLGGELAVLEEYIWAWRGEGDTWYWYKQKDRSVLTSAFKSATPKVRVRSGKHSVALASMIDSHVPTRMMSRVHFQPIPYMYRYESAPLRPIDSASTTAFVGEYGQQGDVRQALRTLSFGSTPVAKLAKMVYLHVVCYGPPSNTEETKAAFRNLVAEHSFALLEYLAKALIQRSRDWAPILLDAGIADAITEVPEMKRQRTEQRAGSSGRTRTSPLATPSRTSPVAQLIRDTSSAMSTPQLKPVSLPESNTSVAQIICRGTYAEVMSLLETSSGGRPLHQEQLDALSDSLRRSSSAMAKVASALSTFLLRELQKASIEGRKRQLLDAVSDASTAFITICKAENAPAPQCASGHPLRIHFSTNWRCDKCHQHTGYGSLACRACNYDLCYQCAESSLRRFEVSATASAADLLRVWRERLRKAKRVSQVSEDDDEDEEEVSDKTHHLLFTSQCVVPASGPIMSLKDRTVHSSTAFGKCDCGEVAPTLYAADLGGSGQQGSSHLVPFLLRLCGDVVLRDPGMLHALLEALESYGTHIFMEGVAGLPVFLREALSALGSHLPLTMKLDVARFLSIECRRYALYHVQEAGLFLRGAVQGEIDSNGLAHKITVTRGDEKAITAKLFDEFSCQNPSLRNKVEFHFDGEEGTGNGPSQELYSELSRTYAGMDCLWYQQEGARVACPTSSALYLKHFFVLGACLARSFIDGCVMEMEMLPQAWGFLRATTPEAVERATNELLRELEPTFMQSMEYLLKSSSEELSDMGLEDDQSKPLTTDTVKAYVNQQVQARLEVCLENLRSMALGVLTSLDLSVLWFLGSEELSMLLGGTRPETRDGKLFTEAELRAAVVEAHGYTAGSKEVEALISLVGGEFTRAMQTHFLEFLTGSARLPLNGLAGLGRKITVVKKDMEESKEQTLPSCNTCFLYFKLPPYSNKEVMRERLTLAITEGRKNFSLS